MSAWWYPLTSDSTCNIEQGSITGSLIEDFQLTHVPCKVGKYPLEVFRLNLFYNGIPEAFFSMTYELDELVGSYFLDTLRTDHFVEVLRYDSVEHIIEGRFQAFLRKRPEDAQFNTPDTISITDGKFNLKIQ